MCLYFGPEYWIAKRRNRVKVLFFMATLWHYDIELGETY